MTVIVYRDNILAADRRVLRDWAASEITKIFRLPENEIIAFAGRLSQAEALKRWYIKGMSKEDWPAFQAKDDSSCIMVLLNKDGCFELGSEPYFSKMEGKFHAWGAGAEIATGALATGASAREAVLIANEYCAACGGGVDEMKLIC